MQDAPETGPNQIGIRYSAVDKLKAVKLYFEGGVRSFARVCVCVTANDTRRKLVQPKQPTDL